jgi:hypothetical protein
MCRVLDDVDADGLLATKTPPKRSRSARRRSSARYVS